MVDTTKETQNLGEKIVRILKTVYDPEIPVDIYELGLIYDVFVNEADEVKVLMTLTTPNCPEAETIPDRVAEAVSKCDNVEDVRVEIVWEPTWTQDNMSEAARLELGFF